MKLNDYFERTAGVGILATADGQGYVDAAIYGRPHFIDDETLVFISAERLTHANFLSNPHAVYLFKEHEGYKGKRLYLTKIREEKDSPLIEEIRRKKHPHEAGKGEPGPKYLILFHLDKVRPLIGDGSLMPDSDARPG